MFDDCEVIEKRRVRQCVIYVPTDESRVDECYHVCVDVDRKGFSIHNSWERGVT